VPDKIKLWCDKGIRFLQQIFHGFIHVSVTHYVQRNNNITVLNMEVGSESGFNKTQVPHKTVSDQNKTQAPHKLFRIRIAQNTSTIQNSLG